jgi:cephalosporin hydroxylase
MILKKIKRLFHKEVSYPLKGIYDGHHQITYRGVPCIKCPFDYVTYQMILDEVKPDLIIEIGTNKGGSALYLADLMEIMGKGQIHSIDIQDEAFDLVRKHPRIKLFTEGWQKYDLELAKNFETVLVIEDSSHEYENTLRAIQRFAPIVSPSSYLIVEDGIVEAMGWAKSYGGGPVKAIDQFLKGNSDFYRDTKWENFFGKNSTFNTKGFLLRK